MTDRMSVKEFRELQTKVIASGGKISASGGILRLDRLPSDPEPQKPAKIIVREPRISKSVPHKDDAVQQVRDRLHAKRYKLSPKWIPVVIAAILADVLLFIVGVVHRF